MSVSNCSAAGADSRAMPITGAVVRKDKLTGADVPAGVRGNGLPSGSAAVKPMTEINGVQASSDVMRVLMSLMGA